MNQFSLRTMLEITAAFAVVLAFIFSNRPAAIPPTVPPAEGPGRYTLVVDAKNRERLFDTQTGATYERNNQGHWSPFADALKRQ